MRGRQAVRLMEAAGWRLYRTGRHFLMRHPSTGALYGVPLGNLSTGQEKAVLKRLDGRTQARDRQREAR